MSTISSFQSPADVAMAPNGKYLYVADSLAEVYSPFVSTSGYGISVVSTATNTITRTIIAASISQPAAVAVSPSGAYVYVLNANGEVSVVSTSSDTVTATIGVPNSDAGASGIGISANGATGYVSEPGIGIIAVLNLSTHLVTRTISVTDPGSLAISPDGKTLYAVTQGTGGTGGQVSVIATASGTVTGNLSPAAYNYMPAIAVTPDGSQLYVMDNSDVDVYATATGSLARTISGVASDDGGTLAFSPDGSTLYAGGPASVTAVDVAGGVDTATTIAISGSPVNEPFMVGSLAVTPNDGTVYALTPDDAATPLAVINAASRTVAGVVPSVGVNPTDVVASPDGSKVYVTSSVGVSVISTASQTATQLFNLGFAPAGIAVSPNGKTLYVTGGTNGDLTMVNAATGAVTDTVSLGGDPSGVAFAPTGLTAYVANANSDAVEVIDVSTGSAVHLVNVTNNPTSVVVSPDGKTVYAGSYYGLEVINAATGKVSKALSIGADQMALSSNGKTLYTGSYYISVVATADNAVVKTLTGEDSILGLAVSPDGGTLYVSIGTEVQVLSTSTYVATTITDPSFSTYLEGIAVTPNGAAAYVADQQNYSLHVLTRAKVAPKITSKSSATFTVGKKGTFTVTTSGYPAATLTETGTLPKGVTFKSNGNGTATLSGTPAAGTGKAYALTLKVSNGVGTAVPQSFKLTVDQAAAITSAAKATFTYRVKGSFTIKTSGYPAAGTITESGALPKGVTFTNKKNGTAVLAGTPAVNASKTYVITIKASNGVGSAVTQKFQLVLKK